MIRSEIKKLIDQAIAKAQKNKKLPDFEMPEILIEHPENKEFGDYSSNIAMVLAKSAKKNPMEIAEIIAKNISDLEAQAAQPGFTNFKLKPELLREKVAEIIKLKDKYGQLDDKKKKISVEFISANPTGQLHIGHARGAFFGDALVKVLKKAGYDTVSEYYINDAQDSAQIKTFGQTALGKGETYLTDYVKQKIEENKKDIEKCKTDGETGSLLAQVIQKDIQEFIEKKLKIKFDNWFSEQKELYDKNQLKDIYKELQKKDLVYEKDGAQWLKTTKLGDKQDWVIVRESGEYTYLLPDIAYHKKRFDKKYDKIINIWGADHQGHVGKIKAAAKILDYKGELEFLITQVVRLKGEKMSKREGKTLTLQWLIDEVGLDAVRFFYLLKSLDSQMEFDLDLAKQQSQKNPVYYVQYAYARICSIFRKADIKPETKHLEKLKEKAELDLIRQLLRLPEIIEDTAQDYQAQHLAYYAMGLAISFHKFYDSCQVLGEDKDLSSARLALAKAAQIVLKNVLDVIGVNAPEKM